MIKKAFIACFVAAVAATAIVSGFSPTAAGVVSGFSWTQIPQGPNVLQQADLVVHNAKVVTVDRASTIAQAVAIRSGRIIAVGTNEQVQPRVGPATRVIDAGGRTVIPGIIDTHVHATGVASAEAVQPFRSLESIGAVQEWIRKEAQRVPPGTWIWSPRMYPTRLREGRFPTRAELDAAAPKHPVVIDGAYALVVNSAALKAADITRATPNPRGGAIVKDIDGEPTGLLRNVGGMLSKFRRADASVIPLDHLERVHQAYNRVGITSIIERGSSVDGYRAYEALKQQNRLHVRSTITIRIPADRIGTVTNFIEELPVKFNAGDEWLKVGPLKIVADGGILIGTSYMRRPYGLQAGQLYGLDDPHYRGFLTLNESQIRGAIGAGHDARWQMVAHVTGDAGVDAVLDGIEAALKDRPRAARHTLIHAYFADPETAKRAARLGVLVDTQPAWYYKDGDALAKGLGKPRLEHFVGLRTWLDAGVRTAINTDHMFGVDPDSAMNPFNPFLTMYVAVARKTEGGQTIGAGEAVTREQALRMMTSDAAYFSFDEGNRGSIGLGKLGDLAILSEDLLTVPIERIRHIRPEVTIVGGKVAYESGRVPTGRSTSEPQPVGTQGMTPIRIGLVGIDTSHAGQFTGLLNDTSRGDHIPGARIVAAYRGGSPDVEASRTRIDKFTADLREKWQIEFVDSIEELVRRVDAVMILSVDGRVHLPQARAVFAARKPLFVDKPFTASVRDARELARLARESGTPLFSSSSLRFNDDVQAIKRDARVPEVLGAITWGPAPTEPHHPDLFWYGIHAVEMLYTFMGPGCERVSRTHTPGADVVVGTWKDGRIGVVRGIRDGATTYGQVVYGRKAIVTAPPPPDPAAAAAKRSSYYGLITHVVEFFRTGKPPVPIDETIEIMAFMEAADLSKSRGGAPVALSELLR